MLFKNRDVFFRRQGSIVLLREVLNLEYFCVLLAFAIFLFILLRLLRKDNYIHNNGFRSFSGLKNVLNFLGLELDVDFKPDRVQLSGGKGKFSGCLRWLFRALAVFASCSWLSFFFSELKRHLSGLIFFFKRCSSIHSLAPREDLECLV
ncbi:hypothetical protein MHF_0264 [Mycoplasma haemofelis Ohio2]|uniref:Uncharacterized protein n=1 Tax=Mycoplasma haemofelis (strain Ohio2) TaxID=859194 RepID=F6FGG4_MYCHI|nr:hypothetical protein MHF_0264 [Mycoplasma haemofelis Ohio2]